MASQDALSVKIRPLQPTDLPGVMQLHRELGWNPAFKADGSTLGQRLAALITEDNALLLVAEHARKVVGYVHGEVVTHLLFAGRELVINEVFVIESARDRGVGKALMAAIEGAAAARKCFRISVLNSRERESYQRGFYPSLGYEERPSVVNFTKRLDWG
ncbi:MAG: GNAT family N-acetyltransferase [Acidiferrobacter sp.]